MIDFRYPYIDREKLPEHVKFLSRSGFPLFKKVGETITTDNLTEKQNEILQKCQLWYMMSDTPVVGTKGEVLLREIEQLLKEELARRERLKFFRFFLYFFGMVLSICLLRHI